MNSIPKGVAFLTAAVDVQGNRLELEVVGWGKGKESWSIDYRVIMGDTATEAPWNQLTELMNEYWHREDDTSINISRLAVDTGFNTLHAYNWVRKHKHTGRVIAIKGREDLDSILGRPKAIEQRPDGSPLKYPITLYTVGVSKIKAELYGWLNLDGAKDDGIYPSGFCHFPQYDENYFQMLTAEEMVTSQKDGKPVYKWVKKYPRNEALDCRVYNRAAATNFGMDRFKDGDWDKLAGMETVKEKTTTTMPKITKPIQQTTNDTQRRQPQNSLWGNRPNLWRK
jgi:phage terminase large subunit GpA-like protein